MTIKPFGKKIYLGILAMALIPAIGGVVQLVQISGLTGQIPFWSGPHPPGPFLGDDPSQFRIMILVTLLITLTLTLAAGFYLVHTFRAFAKDDFLLAEGAPIADRNPDPDDRRTKKPEDDYPPGEPAALPLAAEIVNNGNAFLMEVLPRLASQAAEVVQKANQVMEQSLLALQRCNELTQVTQEVAAENRRNVLEMRRFLEEMAASLENQTRSFH